MISLQKMKTNLLWTETVAVSVADPALLLAVQETCKVIIIVKFIPHHHHCCFSPFVNTVVTSSSSCPSGTVTNNEFLKFIGAEVSPAKEIWND